MSETEKTTYRFNEETLNNLSLLKENLKASSNTEAIKKAISIAYKLTEELKSGSEIKIKRKAGKLKDIELWLL